MSRVGGRGDQVTTLGGTSTTPPRARRRSPTDSTHPTAGWSSGARGWSRRRPELWPDWRYFRPDDYQQRGTVIEVEHREHAVVEQVCAYPKDG